MIDEEKLEALIRRVVAEELRAALAALAAPPKVTLDRERLFPTVAEAAAILRCSKRHLENQIRLGFPMVGEGRGRRVDMANAIPWLRARSRRADDPVAMAQENIARVAARRARSRA